MSKPSASNAENKRFTLERTFDGTLDEVWELWTTPGGFESWWGPEGFSVKVEKLELRAGGELRYLMIATGPDQIAYMKQAGMPLSTPAKMTFTEVKPKTRLAYTNLVDFVPGVTPYAVATEVDFSAGQGGVTMTLTFDPMHDPMWTQQAKAGWEQQLGKLARLFAKR
jgi:uncharacterized protein YndB with AHSA1/START domain